MKTCLHTDIEIGVLKGFLVYFTFIAVPSGHINGPSVRICPFSVRTDSNSVAPLDIVELPLTGQKCFWQATPLFTESLSWREWHPVLASVRDPLTARTCILHDSAFYGMLWSRAQTSCCIKIIEITGIIINESFLLFISNDFQRFGKK